MQEKIDLDTLKNILRDHLDETKQADILRDIGDVLVEEEQDRLKEQDAKPPKVEKKMVVILTALPDSADEKGLESAAGFLTEIPLETPTKTIKSALRDVSHYYKASKKAQKNPADSLGELFELAPTKTFKEHGILKKPKGPLEFVYCPNRG